uniref:Myb-like, SWIRM and MPN domain-containing protein 1 n=1 Tax=Auxenochlorella protothecoides TaxID=3075 RepID=A0A1D2AG52_AUXPR
MDVDAANDAAIARLLANEDGGDDEEEYSLDADELEYAAGAPECLSEPGLKAHGRLSPDPVPAEAGHVAPDQHQLTASGRRKRKDTGKQRTTSRSWSSGEESLFLEALDLHGRDWKKCAEHLVTRDPRAVTSHAQKHFIKLLLRGEALPEAVAASGAGYTLSGRPLDPNCASARAYGLRPDAFHRVAADGKLTVGIHVTSLEMEAEPAGVVKRLPKASAALCAAKRGRKKRGSSDSEDEGRPLAPAFPAAAEGSSPAEPTEYSKARPRRQGGQRAVMGDTSESLDLTCPKEFVGPPGSAAPLAQPFAVVTSSQARLVMDFHAHLSGYEVIGLLGGRYEAGRRVLHVDEAYPCRRAQGSDSGTSVELDPASQVEATTAMSARGQAAVGWYHSHPVFEARPSQKDNENQRNYQALCHDPEAGLAPWVGAIVSPYDASLPSTASQIRMWVVRTSAGRLTPFSIRSQGAEAGPASAHDDTLSSLRAALVAQRDDPSRVRLGAVWRGYTRLVQGHPDGPPLTKLEKLQVSVKCCEDGWHRWGQSSRLGCHRRARLGTRQSHDPRSAPCDMFIAPRFPPKGALAAHLASQGQRDALFSWLLDAVHEEWGVDLQPLAAAKAEAVPAETGEVCHCEPGLNLSGESCAASAGAAEALPPGGRPSLGLT